MKKVKWLLVGAGNISFRRVAPALVEAENSEIIAICDINKESAEKLADRFDVSRVYADYQQALMECDADAVYIATPPNMHVDMCLQALAAEKHFLCEKSLGLNGEECMKLLDTSRKSDRITSCSNYRRLSGQCKATVEILKNNEIGKLLGGWATYAAPPYHHKVTKAWGGGCTKGLGYYIIDIVINRIGMPESVMGQTMTVSPDTDVDEISSIILKFPGGGLFTIYINWFAASDRHKFELFGTKGSIYWPEWPPNGNGPIEKTIRRECVSVDVYTPDNFHLPMIEDFVDAVLNNRQPVCTIESATKTEIVTDAIFRSAATGQLEPVIWEDGN